MARRYLKTTPPLDYSSFLKENVKYNGIQKCFVNNCEKPALYEGGDARFYCGMCEEHSGMIGKYRLYLNDFYPTLNSDKSNEQLYNLILDRHNYFRNKIKEAQESTNGPKFSEIK